MENYYYFVLKAGFHFRGKDLVGFDEGLFFWFYHIPLANHKSSY